MGELMAIIGSKDERVRKAVGRAIAALLEKYPATLQKTIDYLMKAFKDTPDKIVKVGCVFLVLSEVWKFAVKPQHVGLFCSCPVLNVRSCVSQAQDTSCSSLLTGLSE